MADKDRLSEYAERYLDTVFRVALNAVGSYADAEDISQDVFLKLLRQTKPFESEEHVRNWLIRVTINESKNLLRSKWRHNESFDDHAATLSFDSPAHSELFYAVMALDDRYRLPIYLHYYEGYSTQEIGKLLRLPKNTVCSRLLRGREKLKEKLSEV